MSSSTAPWSTSAGDLAGSGFTGIHRLTLLVGDDLEQPLTPVSSRVDFDGRRSPLVTGQLVVGWPDGSTLSVLDPKLYDLSVRIEAGYRVGVSSVEDVQELATLLVTDVERDYIEQTVTLTLASDEAVPIAHPAEVVYAYAVGDTILTAIKAVIGDSFPGQTLVWDTSQADAETFDTAQRIEVGEDRWDAVVDWADVLGCKVWHEGRGVWTVAPVPTTTGRQSPAARLKVGPTGTVSTLRVKDTLDGYANRAAVVYEVKSATSAATITTSGVVAATSTTRPRGVLLSRKRKPEKPARVARLALQRALRRGHSVILSAAALYWVTPRRVVTVDLPGGTQERVLVESASFELDRGTMTLAGQSDNSGLILGPVTFTTF